MIFLAPRPLRHPLFPLMALVFEKCERASSWLDGPTERECDGDIRAFVHLGQQSQQAFHTDNTELDAVVNASYYFCRACMLLRESVVYGDAL